MMQSRFVSIPSVATDPSGREMTRVSTFSMLAKSVIGFSLWFQVLSVLERSP
jgi:hypothetical protein